MPMPNSPGKANFGNFANSNIIEESKLHTGVQREVSRMGVGIYTSYLICWPWLWDQEFRKIILLPLSLSCCCYKPIFCFTALQATIHLTSAWQRFYKELGYHLIPPRYRHLHVQTARGSRLDLSNPIVGIPSSASYSGEGSLEIPNHPSYYASHTRPQPSAVVSRHEWGEEWMREGTGSNSGERGPGLDKVVSSIHRGSCKSKK
jgi:hypothetical protein